MIVKVVLKTMQNAKKLVSIAEQIPCEVELCSGRYVVNAKSMLGVFSMPDFENGELHVHTDEIGLCDTILQKLLDQNLLLDTNDAVSRSIYDITAFGEILVDFTRQGTNEDGQPLFALSPGGAPANVAVAAARLGAHTAFLGKAGKDMHGEFLQDILKKEKVETAGLILDETCFTTMAFVDNSIHSPCSFSFARKPGADMLIQKEEVDVDILDRTHIFHVSSLSLTDQPARDTTFYAVKRAKAKGSLISYAPNYRPALWKDNTTAAHWMKALIPYADMMKLSREETELLTGYDDAEQAAKALYELGVKIVVVTLGSEGAYVFCKEGGCLVAGFACNVVDRNGAGATFWGSFLYDVHNTGKRPEELTLEELKDYVRFGNAAASLCLEKKGAIPAMPQLLQVQERMGI